MTEILSSKDVVESLKRALAWDWTEISKDALGQIQQALRLAVADAPKNVGNESGITLSVCER
jgi:hypothetical protein